MQPHPQQAAQPFPRTVQLHGQHSARSNSLRPLTSGRLHTQSENHAFRATLPHIRSYLQATPEDVTQAHHNRAGMAILTTLPQRQTPLQPLKPGNQGKHLPGPLTRQKPRRCDRVMCGESTIKPSRKPPNLRNVFVPHGHVSESSLRLQHARGTVEHSGGHPRPELWHLAAVPLPLQNTRPAHRQVKIATRRFARSAKRGLGYNLAKLAPPPSNSRTARPNKGHGCRPRCGLRKLL